MLCSLGTALLDEFRWLDDDGLEAGRPREVRLGGGGVYGACSSMPPLSCARLTPGRAAAIGARVWSRDVGLLVDRGPDFPSAVQRQLDSFGPIWHYRDVDTPTPRVRTARYRLKPSRATLTRLTTSCSQALNLSRPPSSTRDFSYLTPPPERSLDDLSTITTLDKLSFLHLCCPPSSLAALLPSLADLSGAPQLVYEPIPFACTPAELPQLADLLSHVRVFSPNHDEAAVLLGVPAPPSAASGSHVEQLTRRFRKLGARDVVIRAGERGAFVLPDGALEGSWVPPFHSSADKVKDTVGAGNAFLVRLCSHSLALCAACAGFEPSSDDGLERSQGGLMAGLALSHDIERAARYGAVSAGIVVESIGLPVLTTSESEKEEELWNGRSARARLEDMDR